MIANDTERQITLDAIAQFDKALAVPVLADATKNEIMLDALMRDSCTTVAGELRAQVAEFDALREGQKTSFTADLHDLGDALRLARGLVGLTQKELGAKIGIKQQQIQHYEAVQYEHTSLSRLLEVCWALGIKVQIECQLPDPLTAAKSVLS